MTLDLLSSSTVAGENRPYVPLSALGDIKLLLDLATISRRNGERVNTVQGFITAGVLPGKVLTNFNQRLAASSFERPPGYSSDFGGEADARNTAIANIVSTVGVLGILMAGTLQLCSSAV